MDRDDLGESKTRRKREEEREKVARLFPFHLYTKLKARCTEGDQKDYPSSFFFFQIFSSNNCEFGREDAES